MEDPSEQILEYISREGPSVPTAIGRETGSDSLLASARLSELSSHGKLRISSLKLGSSPLYYLPGQESQLQSFAENLHEKEKKAYDFLLKKQVVDDASLEPMLRVAMRSIKDFAVALNVNHDGNTMLFWKWFLLTNEEAGEKIKSILSGVKPEVPKSQPKKEIGKEHSKSEARQEVKPKVSKLDVQKRLAKPQPKRKQIVKEKEVGGVFLEALNAFFKKNTISVLTQEVLKKTEFEFTVHIPSAVGDVEYYCKARQKKSINDADLASAFVQGQLRKLPVLFLTTGKLTKRAQEMLEKDFKGMQVMFVEDGSSGK